MKICLTGATGFIGKNLLKRFEKRNDLEVIALSRKVSPIMDNAKKGNITWVRCNGFSLLDAERATEGADVLIYLIHSMLPSSALAQGDFSDFDLYLADNFARAARKNGVKKIIYLSSLIPEGENLSNHLKSRLEVEGVLSQFGNSVTVLRSGLIVGENGSSFRILEKLVKRLPAFVCPAWTLSQTQPIDLEDVLESIEYCLSEEHANKIYDIGGPDIITYKKMLELTSDVLGKRRPIINIPFFSPELSKLWVSKVTSTPPSLVYPLVESLKHKMVVDPQKQLVIPNHKYKKFLTSLKKGVKKDGDNFVRSIINYNASFSFRWLENVTSIQRICLQRDFTAAELADSYFTWLPRFLGPIIQVKVDEGRVVFKFFSLTTLLELEKCADRSGEDRVFYYIRGGLLARETTLNGRLEFRVVKELSCAIAALLDYRPSLPWFIYKYTQALFHLFVMKRFERFVEKSKN